MTERDITLRIAVVDPPPDLAFALQRGRAELVAASCWSRRAKVSLAGVTADLVHAVVAQPQACLEATIPGRAGDG